MFKCLLNMLLKKTSEIPMDWLELYKIVEHIDGIQTLEGPVAFGSFETLGILEKALEAHYNDAYIRMYR